MIPKEQKVVYYWDTKANDNTLEKEVDKWVEKGWVIHQIIPFKQTDSHYLLLYKY